MKKILVANRGEIALRVFRTAKELGIETVAVFSEADADALHVRAADHAISIGQSEPSQSYLSIPKIIDAAQISCADAIHPGYGFLSERSTFARACREADITFIGPSPEAMDRLGSKIDAKQLAVANQVPITPGFFENGASAGQLKSAACEIGFPVMLKASAGGGGRGMRIVRNPEDFDQELELAMDEAQKGFGDSAMMVEKLVERPRHIEVQVLADKHGNIACLFERECSIQRRHQKVIEEAPSPFMTGELWEKMQDATKKLVRAAEYEGAGTVEFMVDAEGQNFYFLEVNARLQVEHPVTESITGLDLVEWQIRIAKGERLDLSPGLMAGDRNQICGHAIEARVVAEDPSIGFLPSIGSIYGWSEPHGNGIRFDSGYSLDQTVSRFYDSLLGKVIASHATREGALKRLELALLETHILGVKTNIAFLIDLLRHPNFRNGMFDTGFIGREFGSWAPSDKIPEELANILNATSPENVSPFSKSHPVSLAWEARDSWRNART